MAISQEAYAYLHELEQLEAWTKIPESDERIIKLRTLFKVTGYETLKQLVGNKERERNVRRRESRFQVKVTKGDETAIFDNARDCAHQLDLSISNIYESIRQGFYYKGMKFEKVEIKK